MLNMDVIYCARIVLLTLLSSLVICQDGKSPPKVLKVDIKQVPLENVLDRQEMLLECAVSGNPLPTVKWIFNGSKEITEDDERVSLSRGNKRLRIEGVKRYQDCGMYTCEAYSKDYGTTFGEKFVTVGVSGKFKPGQRDSDPMEFRKVKLGSNLTIQCPDHTEGTLELYVWGELPSQQLPRFWTPGQDSERAFVGDHGELVFAYVTQEDVKKIRDMRGIQCILYLSQSYVPSKRIMLEADGEVDVKIKPQLQSFMKPNFEAVVNERFQIKCGAIGKPLPKIEWFKDGKKLIEDDHYLYSNTNGFILELANVKTSDEGTYKCTATNSEGSDAKEGYLTVLVPATLREDIPSMTNQFLDSKVNLTCDVYGHPKPAITWYHNNTIFTGRTGVQIVDQSVIVEKAQFDDSGMYTCAARNRLHTSVSSGFLQVDPIPPKFVSKFEPKYYFFKRHDHELMCDVTGGPPPVKVWYKGSTVLPAGKNSDGVIAKASGELEFKAAKVEMEGDYKCVATNVADSAEDGTNVRVVEKTVITKPPESLSYRQTGVDTSFFCDAVFEKETLGWTFQWLRDGAVIEDSDTIFKEPRLTGISRILFVKDIQTSYNGEFTCQVYTYEQDGSKRIISEDRKSATLSVIASPKKPSGGVSITGDCSKFNATLSWTAAEAVGAAVKFYIVEYATYESNEMNKWFKYNRENPKIMAPTTSVQLTRTLLPANADLQFRVRAGTVSEGEDLIGEPSDPSDYGECETPAGAPLFNPSNVEAVYPAKPGELTIKWDKLLKIHQGADNFGYKVGYRVEGEKDFTVSDPITDPSQTTYTLSPPPGPGKKVEFYVLSSNEKGDGPNPDIKTAYSGRDKPTSVPGSFTIKAIYSTYVTLAWEKVADAEQYRVYFWSTGRARSNVRRRRAPQGASYQDLDGETGGNVTGLKPLTTYRMTVAASNNGGIGPESSEQEFSTKEGVPSPPTDVELDVMGDKIRLRWKHPEEDNGKRTKYVVKWYPSGKKDGKPQTMTLDPDTDEAFITTGLEPLRYYDFELVAATDSGEGEPWKQTNVVVGFADKPGKPAPPSWLSSTNTTIKVIFQLPEDYIGGLPDSYTVYYRNTKNKDVVMEETQEYPKQKFVLLTNLNEKDDYEIWTDAKNGLGTSPNSGKVTASPMDTAVIVIPPTTPLLTTTQEVLNTSTPAQKPVIEGDQDEAWYMTLWFLILVLCIILLIIIIIIIYCCLQRRGGKYPVGKKEKDRGWDDTPLTDYAETPYDDYSGIPVKNKEPIKSASVSSVNKPPLSDDDDRDSLDDYGEDANFDDNASFIGQYGKDAEKSAAPPQANGYTAV